MTTMLARGQAALFVSVLLLFATAAPRAQGRGPNPVPELERPTQLSVTVAAPQRSPAELETERLVREREVTAQERAASAAEKQVRWQWFAMLLSVLGLVASTFLAFRASKSAEKSADAAAATLEKMLKVERPVVSVAVDYIPLIPDQRVVFRLKFKNAGKEHAEIFEDRWDCILATIPPTHRDFKAPMSHARNWVPANDGFLGDRIGTFTVSADEINEILTPHPPIGAPVKRYLWVYGYLKYRGTDERTYETAIIRRLEVSLVTPPPHIFNFIDMPGYNLCT